MIIRANVRHSTSYKKKIFQIFTSRLVLAKGKWCDLDNFFFKFKIFCFLQKKKMKLQLAVVLCLAVSCLAAKSRYDNYKLYSMQLKTEDQAKAVVSLEENTDSYDFWSATSLVRDTDVMVPPHKIGEFEDFLERYNIQYEIKVEDVQK